MKHLSLALLAKTVTGRRKALKLSQAELSKATGINRSILSRLESCDYSPAVDQLLALSAVLNFPLSDVIADDDAVPATAESNEAFQKLLNITIAGVGYVGLSLAVLLAQNHNVTAITTTEAKADKLNQFISPIQDDEIERFFKEAREGKRKLNLRVTTDKASAYKNAELVIIATPTN